MAKTGAKIAGLWWKYKDLAIAVLALVAIMAHLAMRWAIPGGGPYQNLPLFAAFFLGGIPLVVELLVKMAHGEFGSDLLAGLSIIVSLFLQEYLAGVLVILMLSGGQALEAYAVRSASSVLEALAKRMPSVAHKKSQATLVDIPLEAVAIGDTLVVLPHEICPVDGTVLEGHGVMDESYLTGEPYMMSKTPGSTVLSGAINGESALTITADKRAIDSRYARIMEVMRQSAQQRPRMRRLADQLGGLYTPIAVAIALLAWVLSGEATRFLAVLVVATPCPLLIAIPVALIGSISLAAKKGIIIRDPVVLEKIDTCQTIIFDKTGTLTYGEPQLTEQWVVPGQSAVEVLSLVASLEHYSRHPLARAIVTAGQEARVVIHPVDKLSEPPGQGLSGEVAKRKIGITNRKRLLRDKPELEAHLPTEVGGLECLILLDDQFVAAYRFRDTPRKEGELFVRHLTRKHPFLRVMLVSGDRESEVKYLANLVGIKEVYASQSPEQKLAIVKKETAQAPTVFVGDGINDAPALMAATVGIAFGQNSDITTEAAGVVVLDTSLEKVDEFMHISRRMRRIALESAVGGMVLSGGGMVLAALGLITPVIGAVAQELIDVFAVLNALRVAIPPRELTDF